MEHHTEAGGMATVTPALSCAGVIEWAGTNYSAYVPDLPGCMTTGATVEETIASMREAITGHLAVMRDYGDSVPEPRTRVAMIEVETGIVASGDAVQR